MVPLCPYIWSDSSACISNVCYFKECYIKKYTMSCTCLALPTKVPEPLRTSPMTPPPTRLRSPHIRTPFEVSSRISDLRLLSPSPYFIPRLCIFHSTFVLVSILLCPVPPRLVHPSPVGHPFHFCFSTSATSAVSIGRNQSEADNAASISFSCLYDHRC